MMHECINPSCQVVRRLKSDIYADLLGLHPAHGRGNVYLLMLVIQNHQLGCLGAPVENCWHDFFAPGAIGKLYSGRWRID